VVVVVVKVSLILLCSPIVVYGAGEYFGNDPMVSFSYCNGGNKMIIFAILTDPSGLTHSDERVMVIHKPEHHLPLFTLTFRIDYSLPPVNVSALAAAAPFASPPAGVAASAAPAPSALPELRPWRYPPVDFSALAAAASFALPPAGVLASAAPEPWSSRTTFCMPLGLDANPNGHEALQQELKEALVFSLEQALALSAQVLAMCVVKGCDTEGVRQRCLYDMLNGVVRLDALIELRRIVLTFPRAVLEALWSKVADPKLARNVVTERVAALLLAMVAVSKDSPAPHVDVAALATSAPFNDPPVEVAPFAAPAPFALPPVDVAPPPLSLPYTTEPKKNDAPDHGTVPDQFSDPRTYHLKLNVRRVHSDPRVQGHLNFFDGKLHMGMFSDANKERYQFATTSYDKMNQALVLASALTQNLFNKLVHDLLLAGAKCIREQMIDGRLNLDDSKCIAFGKFYLAVMPEPRRRVLDKTVLGLFPFFKKESQDNISALICVFVASCSDDYIVFTRVDVATLAAAAPSASPPFDVSALAAPAPFASPPVDVAPLAAAAPFAPTVGVAPLAAAAPFASPVGVATLAAPAPFAAPHVGVATLAAAAPFASPHVDVAPLAAPAPFSSPVGVAPFAAAVPFASPPESPSLCGTARCMHINGIALRTGPASLGQRTGVTMTRGEVFAFTKTTSVQYEGAKIVFYELADGRGWVHDYPSRSDQSQIEILVYMFSLSLYIL
jgi:hypothetical protein